MRHLRKHVILFFLLLMRGPMPWHRGARGGRGLPALFVIICSPVSVALYVIYFYILARTVLTAVRIECPVCGRSIRLVND